MIPSIDTLLRIKAGNPNAEFHGKTKEVYEEFLEKQKENELLEAIHERELAEKASKKKKMSKTQKRIKQILETPTSVAADLEAEQFVSNESNDEEVEEIVQSEEENE